MLEKLTKKQIRIILGFTMMMTFINLVLQFNFFAQASVRFANPVIGFIMVVGVLNYFWVPAVFYIVLTYILLTRVYKYESSRFDKKKV
jgi:hypothetical protein